jgi:hypothetical protein
MLGRLRGKLCCTVCEVSSSFERRRKGLGVQVGIVTYCAYHDDQSWRNRGVEDIVPVNEINSNETSENGRAELDEAEEEEELDRNPNFCG